MAGNILGGRSYYAYTDDAGNMYSILQDDTLANAVGAVMDDSNPGPPRRFRPRGVHVETTAGGRLKRKFLICPDVASGFYNSITTQAYDLNGLSFDSTGRRGESITFARNADAQDVTDIDTNP